MLHYKTIDTKTLELLKNIQSIPAFKELRLVGGTSLALQIGHRISVDIDLFGELEIDRETIINKLNKIGEVKTINYTNNINILIINDIKVDIVNYTYPWIKNKLIIDNIKLANMQDIAAMKISAITNRGTKKDFVDLYFLLQKYTLNQILDFYQKKYNDASVFLALKSITYFNDAETEIIPKMIINKSWQEIKTEIIKQVNDYVKL